MITNKLVKISTIIMLLAMLANLLYDNSTSEFVFFNINLSFIDLVLKIKVATFISKYLYSLYYFGMFFAMFSYILNYLNLRYKYLKLKQKSFYLSVTFLFGLYSLIGMLYIFTGKLVDDSYLCLFLIFVGIATYIVSYFKLKKDE